MTNRNADEFSQDLINVVSQHENFDMTELTDFQWDRLMVFYPYTSREEMEKKIGQEWTTYSYIGYYLLQKTFSGDYPLDDDSINKIVFMKDEQIVLDVTFLRDQVDFTQIKQMILREEAQFFVEDKILKQDNEL